MTKHTRRSNPFLMSIAVLALGGAALTAVTALATPAAAQDRLLGVLDWRGYQQTHQWRMEWEPIARLGEQGWEALPGDGRPAVDTLWAPAGWGHFLPASWSTTSWGCDTTIAVAVGRWAPGRVPENLPLDAPICGTAPGPWPQWGLSDPASVWHDPERPGELGEALSGLTRLARDLTAERLTPGLEIDPDVPWVREKLRLADPIGGDTLELMGRFRGAVRLRGGGASSPAVVHFWVSTVDGRRRFRALLLDLPEAGAARSSRQLVTVLRRPETDVPVIVLREVSAAGRRHTLLEPGPDGNFRQVYATPWHGCD